MAKKSASASNLTSDSKGKRHRFTPEETAKGVAARMAEQVDKDVPVVMRVVSGKDCEREEVLKFCLDELKGGTTYNDLRKKLGLGPMHLDGRWRKIRRILSDMILPANEEEAVLAGYSSTQFMIRRMEEFLTRIEERKGQMTDDKNEHHYWKLELEALRALLEKQEKRTDQYLKMKELQKAEKGRRGSTIIFQNNYSIPRPGEVPKDVTPLQDAAQLVGAIHDLEDEDDGE